MRDPERVAGSYSERGGVAGTVAGSYTAGSGSAWQYRSIPYEGEDRDKSAARREMEARATSSSGSSSSSKAVAQSNNDTYSTFNMYGRDADVMRGSESKASSSNRSERDRDTDIDSAVQNKPSLKLEEDRTQLSRKGSFREEKAMVSGAYEAAARGAAETGSGSAPWPYPSDVSAASKEAFGQGTGPGMGMRKSSSNLAHLGSQIPLEQKVRTDSTVEYSRVHYRHDSASHMSR